MIFLPIKASSNSSASNSSDQYCFQASESLTSPHKTTSSPKGYHLTFVNLAADIAFPPSSNRLAGDTTTPP
jgi:hypothetical protein